MIGIIFILIVVIASGAAYIVGSNSTRNHNEKQNKITRVTYNKKDNSSKKTLKIQLIQMKKRHIQANQQIRHKIHLMKTQHILQIITQKIHRNTKLNYKEKRTILTLPL
ncbi:hypothetical protein LSA_2p00140 (plasmid) [Fructilactobacillus sanfranciscensis TMW 1.1304]|uniref:Uncharacterized protein n=1 Tax=Fructilactobacillus sanfranciscensis (strain TMW 1.1304) TaxID=714313 RepID=G2KWS1_FRUST|nr:hypothetical protein LSA_2p00140 [Fructilactobacillus sanfranciscensis TMW 1.1304]POH19775.1 hypothetical protein BGL44_05145 [Fructilactobacillus sanfranciscensis]